MPAPRKKVKKKELWKKPFGIVDPSVKNYENHPFFVKKAKEAKEWLKKVGLPEELKGKYKI